MDFQKIAKPIILIVMILIVCEISLASSPINITLQDHSTNDEIKTNFDIAVNLSSYLDKNDLIYQDLDLLPVEPKENSLIVNINPTIIKLVNVSVSDEFFIDSSSADLSEVFKKYNYFNLTIINKSESLDKKAEIPPRVRQVCSVA